MSPSTPNIDAIQAALRQQKIDGWLFYDILHRDPIAYRVLGLGHAMAKRRWFYMIPKEFPAKAWCTALKLSPPSIHCR